MRFIRRSSKRAPLASVPRAVCTVVASSGAEMLEDRTLLVAQALILVELADLADSSEYLTNVDFVITIVSDSDQQLNFDEDRRDAYILADSLDDAGTNSIAFTITNGDTNDGRALVEFDFDSSAVQNYLFLTVVSDQFTPSEYSVKSLAGEVFITVAGDGGLNLPQDQLSDSSFGQTAQSFIPPSSESEPLTNPTQQLASSSVRPDVSQHRLDEPFIADEESRRDESLTISLPVDQFQSMVTDSTDSGHAYSHDSILEQDVSLVENAQLSQRFSIASSAGENTPLFDVFVQGLEPVVMPMISLVQIIVSTIDTAVDGLQAELTDSEDLQQIVASFAEPIVEPVGISSGNTGNRWVLRVEELTDDAPVVLFNDVPHSVPQHEISQSIAEIDILFSDDSLAPIINQH
jgi:hypothetical protein